MSDYDEAYSWYADTEDDYCDCADAEWDLVEGTAHCQQCGNRRVLTSDEIEWYWKGQAEFEREMDRIRWRDRLSQIWWIIRYRLLFWRRRAPYELDDDIPF